MCPRFDSWWHHNLKSYSFRVTLFLYIRGCSGLRCTNRQARCLAQLVEQRTDIVYKLALCPRFDSWWHHVKRVILRSDSFFCLSGGQRSPLHQAHRLAVSRTSVVESLACVVCLALIDIVIYCHNVSFLF